VPHPAGDKDVSSLDTLHAVLFDSAKPVLIAPSTVPSTIGRHICIGWNGAAESASAVMAALPWLHRAESRRILWQKTINGADQWHRISSSTSPHITSQSTERRSNR
jgi:hypothetical protein